MQGAGERAGSSTAAIRLVSSIEEFTALRDQWKVVEACLPGSRAFFSHEWFDAALRWQGQTAKLNMLCCFLGQQLIAVLPLVLREVKSRGIRVRELSFLTVPDTQSCDLIVAAADRATASAAFAAELRRRAHEWDVMRLYYLPPASAAATLGAALESHGFTSRTVTAPGNPFITLDSTWDAYYASRSRRLKKSNNLAANRLHKAGSVRIDWLAPESHGVAFDSFVDRCVAISARSWKTRTGNSLDNPGPQAFIRRLSEVAARRGWLSVWVLSLNEQPVAMEYQLVADGGVYALRSDFDAEFDAMSPGGYLSGYLLKELFGKGLQRYYMGPGNNAYKYRWTDEVETVEELTVYGRSLAGRCIAAWETTLKPMAVKLRNRVRGRASSPEQ